MRGTSVLVVVLAAAAIAVGLSTAGSVTPARAAACQTSSKWLASWRQTYSGRVVRPTSAYRRPGSSAFLQLATADPYGFPTTVSVLERMQTCRARWYRVRLATWPNGTTGWVRGRDLSTTRLRARIVVDISRHRLFLYKAGKLVFTSPAAIGKPSTPTPRGTFFVTQRFVVSPTTGPFGPRALGISAFSPVLRSWRDGGPIGIHGTNEPFSIGDPVSHGCVRLPNDRVLALFKVTPLGTPVLIRE